MNAERGHRPRPPAAVARASRLDRSGGPLRNAIAVFCVALLSCERSEPPAVPAAPPPPPRRIRTSFGGTWLTDRGALVIQRNESWYQGSFLPLNHPGVRFSSPVDQPSLEFRSFEGQARWKGSFALVRDGSEIEGQIQLENSPLPLPCRGRWIGSSADHGRPALLRTLEHDDPWLRREAAHALGALGPAGRDAIPGLIQALRDPEEDVLRAIHFALARLGAASASSVPMLRCQLKDEVPGVRAAAADALGGLGAGGVDAQQDLARGLEDPDVAVRMAALKALLSVSEEHAVDLAELLDEESPALALRIVEALRRRGASAQTALEILACHLTHPASREAARSALAP